MKPKDALDAGAVTTDRGPAADGAVAVRPASARPTTGPRARAPLRFTIRIACDADGRWAAQLAPDVVSRFASRHEAIAAGKAVALRGLAAKIERGVMRDSDQLEVVFDVREG